MSDISGMTLIGVMVAGAVAAVLSLAVSKMIINHGRSVSGIRNLASRDQLVNRLARLAGDPAVLSKSELSPFTENLSFKGCAQGTCGTPPCCDSALDQPFFLVDPITG